MTKHLYRHAVVLQEQLMGAAMLHPAEEWVRCVPRVQPDAWATLWRWHQAGEPIVRITEEMESALLARPPDPATPLANVPLQREALACQLPDRSQWMVVARHAPAPAYIPVHGEHGWAYGEPVLTYCGSSALGTESGLVSGFVNLLDQPTLGALLLGAGTITAAVSEEPRPLQETAILADDYRFTLALAEFLRRASK